MFDAVLFSKYAGVSLALILSGFGAPIPEEVPIVSAGAMVGHDAQESHIETLIGALGGGPAFYLTPTPTGLTRWWIMLPVCIVSVVVGDSVLFLIGRIWGSRLLEKAWVQRRILPREKQAKIQENFEKYGIMILLGARLTPGIRTPVFIMAGVLRMPVQRFLLADALYAVPGVNLFFWLAYWFTDQFVEAIQAVDRHRPIVVVAVLSAVVGIVIYKFATSRRLSTGDIRDIPVYVKPVGVVTHAIEQTIEKSVAKTVETTTELIQKVTHSRPTESPSGHDVATGGPGTPAEDPPAAPPLHPPRP